MKKDIVKLIKKARGYLNEIEEVKNIPADARPQEWKDKQIQEKKQKLKEIVDKEFNDLKRYNKESREIAQSKLNELFEGDDKARQRYQNEVRNDLNGVEDIDKALEYYEQVKAKEPELKRVETAKVIKNKLWKSGKKVEQHNFKKKMVEDMPEKELKYRKKISLSNIKKSELNSLENSFKSFIVDEGIKNGEIDPNTEKALIQDYGNKEVMEKKAEVVDTI